MLDSKDANYGYNALSNEYEDLVKAGVLDPTKVVRTALQNAGSIASLMLTTEALVADIPEEKKGAPQAADTAAAWTACTKKLSAISFQLNQKPRSQEWGFFCVQLITLVIPRRAARRSPGRLRRSYTCAGALNRSLGALESR